ncbi:MAG: dihydroneopterin aldolase [Candidatus Omnitrophota bacterium]
MVTISINDLCVKAFIGTKAREKQKRQNIVIQVSFDYDAARAIRTDHLADAVDYAALSREIIRRIEDSRFQLIEKLADAVMKILLAHPGVKAATVEIEKPQAIKSARSVSVRMRRKG